MSEPTKLYIYHLSQTDDNGPDTYSDCVVIANSEEQARLIHPNGQNIWKGGSWGDGSTCNCHTWAAHPNNVKMQLMGEVTVNKYKNMQVVCKSFHAG